LGRWKGGQKEFPWLDLREDVKDLIAQFGVSAGANLQYPFVRLRFRFGFFQSCHIQ
tara:strand:+ start:6216 stop:6383 length:168 start_codon:yes stop_codon:yes gene_type:complete